MCGGADPVDVSLSLKGETLCSVKDFRINIFIPGAEDMIMLTLGTVAPRLLVDKCPAESLQQQGDNMLSDSSWSQMLLLTHTRFHSD